MKNMKKSDYYSFVQKKKMEDKPFMIHTNVKRIACWLVIPIFSSPFFFFFKKKVHSFKLKFFEKPKNEENKCSFWFWLLSIINNVSHINYDSCILNFRIFIISLSDAIP